MRVKFKISNFRFQNSEKGITLLEFLVVVAIIGIFAATTSVLYPAAERRRNVALAAEQIKADLRFAQNQALSFKKHGGVFARGGYGIHFENGSSTYKIFADLQCEGATGCSPSTFLRAADGSRYSPPIYTLKAQGVSWNTDEWLGGNMLIIAGACAGNMRYISANTRDELYVDEPFTHSDGSSCVPEGPSGDQSQFIIFGNARIDEGEGELVEERQIKGATISLPLSSYDVVFTPPKPELKVNRRLHTGSDPITITVASGSTQRRIDVYANGFIEIR